MLKRGGKSTTAGQVEYGEQVKRVGGVSVLYSRRVTHVGSFWQAAFFRGHEPMRKREKGGMVATLAEI